MMNSEERRKQIEKWNEEITESEENKEEEKVQDKKEGGGNQGLSIEAQRILSQLYTMKKPVVQQGQQGG